MGHRSSLVAVASVAILATVGCSSKATNPPPGCSRSTSGDAVGAICRAVQVAAVTPHGGSANTSIGNGTALHKNDTITTNQTGSVDFWINTKIKKCRGYYGAPNSATAKSGVEVVVWPPKHTSADHQVLLQYMKGYVTCSTTKSNGQGIVLSVQSKVYITTVDPVWTVAVGDDDAIQIRVYDGVIQVGKDEQSTVPVEANNEIDIAPDGTIGKPAPFEPAKMPQAEQDAVAFVEE
jgi:hypothetical protein